MNLGAESHVHPSISRRSSVPLEARPGAGGIKTFGDPTIRSGLYIKCPESKPQTRQRTVAEICFCPFDPFPSNYNICDRTLHHPIHDQTERTFVMSSDTSATRPSHWKLTRISIPGGLGDGPIGIALGQVASHHNLLPLVLEGLRHGPAGDGAGLVEGL